ncbi:MAG: T9SS type A sorting domain-containing protein [Crocinitomicaceae bacterium]|nr:T9SS type A sorting domain-containing protein [Crocinitomicaceae bacterium]
MKRSLLLFTLLLGIFSYGQPTCQLKHQLLDDLHLKKYKSGDESLRSDTVDVLNYSIFLDFTQAPSNLLYGACEVKFKALMDINTLSLDLLQLNIDSIVFQGNQVPFSYNDTLIVANFGGTVTTGSIDSLTVYYGGVPQMDPSGWGGFYMQLTHFYNLGVGFESIPHNFGRAWHPCFDNFVERATYDYQVLTANNFTAYCNGTRTNVQTVGTDSLLTSWVLSEPIPSYLASVAVGEYVHVSDPYFSSLQGISIPVWLTARDADTTNLKNSFLNLHNAIAAFEAQYGPYVWERVGFVLVPFSSGAMEHATNIAYPLLTANGLLTYETLMAHELSHHWWGDWVTCETAEEMWINEGMAVYSEHIFLENVYDYDTYMTAVRDNHYNVLHRAHVDDSGHYALNAVPLKWTYGEHSYRKGADVVHTLRGYLGDANFFAGLKAVQNTYGGGSISSAQFRDAMNSVAGVDVTQFFDDWIFQPGYSQFAITNMTSTQNGGNYDVTIVVDQKLKGAANNHTDVPLQVTFMDAGWNEHTDMITMSGDFASFTFSVPFEPVFAALNMDEKINDAVTAQNEVLTAAGIKTFTYANMRLFTTSITDSAYLRVEHNWVYADGTTNLTNVVVSQDRYWNIHGIDLDNVQGELRFEFNAQNNTTGDLDHSILQAVGGQAFQEDSVVLLYRPNAQSDWQIHPDYSLNTLGSPVDKKGWCETNIFMPGQYCFGYRVHSVSVEELSYTASEYSIYPNPSDDSIFIDLTNWKEGKYAVEIYAINGQFMKKQTLNGASVNHFSVKELGAGTYLMILTDGANKRYGSKRVIVK